MSVSFIALAKNYLRSLLHICRTFDYPLRELQYIDYLKSNPQARTPAEFFAPMGDRLFYWTLTRSHELGLAPDICVPALPSPWHRRNWTGDAGDWTFRQAFAFHKLIRNASRKYQQKKPRDLRILDFGCGWGRILRFFLRDSQAAHLYGCDCWPEIVETARQDNPWVGFSVVPTVPDASYTLPYQELDVIYLYSVFSHLSAEAQLAWIEQFHRVLAPGGLLIATTRGRDFLERLERKRPSERNRGAWVSMLATEAFPDIRQALRDYDAGQFCFAPTGGGGPLDTSFYGEAAVPAAWFREHWQQYDILEVLPAHGILDQLIVIARKK